MVSGDVDHHHQQQHGIEIVFCAENEWLYVDEVGWLRRGIGIGQIAECGCDQTRPGGLTA